MPTAPTWCTGKRSTAIYPRQFGDWVSRAAPRLMPTTREAFRRGTEPPIVVAFTSTGRGECIAFSNDRGKTWQEYEGNPVVKHAGTRSQARLARTLQALDHGRL